MSFGFEATLSDSFAAEVVIEGLTGLWFKCFASRFTFANAVDTEASKIIAQFAPGGEGPDGSPEIESERTDVAAGGFVAAIGIGDAENFVRRYSVAQLIHERFDGAMGMNGRGVDLGIVDFSATVFRESQDNFVECRAGCVGNAMTSKCAGHAKANDHSFNFFRSKHEGR